MIPFTSLNFRLPPNTNTNKYVNYNGVHQRHNSKLNAMQNEWSISGHSRQPYGNEKHMDSLGMSHNMMSNSSSNGESVGKQFVSSRVSQDIEYQKPFPLKEQYDSTSTENISGKLYSYNIILLIIVTHQIIVFLTFTRYYMFVLIKVHLVCFKQ